MSSKATIELIDRYTKVEMRFIEGTADWILQPFEGPMQKHELEELLETIKREKWRCHLHVEQTKDKKYYNVKFERSIKEEGKK